MRIDIKDLFYLYEDVSNENVAALRGIFLSVESGECLVIKGPNGSGKSTLVRILSGFLSPSAGDILFDGVSISTIDPLLLRRKYVSSIDQKGNLLADLSVEENITLSFALSGFTMPEAQSMTESLLAEYKLNYLAGSFPQELSAGERQMCALLAALAGNPKILIADEPSGELDNLSAETIYRALNSYAGKMTIILVTHDSRADKYADRIVRIRNGRISTSWLPNESEEPITDPHGWMHVAREENDRPATPPAKTFLTTEANHAIIRADSISLSTANRILFSDLSLTASSGEFITITGSSGTGKSSLLRILCGIQNPIAGKVFIEDQDLSLLSREERAELRRKSVAFLSQGNSPIAHISLSEYFPEPAERNIVGFESRLNRKLATFSGGERARIEILRILSDGHESLLLDEPTSQLDERQSDYIASLLRDHVSAGGLVITCTRDVALLAQATQTISLDTI